MIRRSRTAIQLALSLVLAIGLLLGSGCGDDSRDTTAPDSAPAAADSHEEPTNGEDDSVSSLAGSNAAFAFDLYRELRSDPGNLFFSPYSVSAALAMTLAGARGETAAQMDRALRFELDRKRLHQAFSGLNEVLNSRGEPSERYEGEGFEFHVVNAAWPQTGYSLLETFVDTIETNYGAGLRALDFKTDPTGARTTINDWVSEQTAEKIQDLLPAGSIDEATRLVLTNAIYFNAPWLNPFAPGQTVNEPFALLAGETVDVPMMHLTRAFLYAEWEGGAAVEIPYNGNELTMIVLVPDEGAFEVFDASLTVEEFDEIVGSLETRSVALGLPRFEYTYDASLVKPLMALGMTDAFDGGRADFSGITGEPDLFISDVLHKAFVSVDEEGTEAAAATAVVFRESGIPAQPITLTIDRPFLFVIRDRHTGSILFIGRVVEP